MLSPYLLALALQTPHPCDVPAPIVDTTRQPFAVTVCLGITDEFGEPADPVTTLKVWIDGVVIATVPNPVAVSGPSATGWSLYRVEGLRSARGARVLTFTAVNKVGESAASDSVPFALVGGPPAKPLHPRVEAR